MRIIDVPQGSGDWLRARAGVITASEFSNLITPLFKKRTGETPDTYLLRKVAEHYMGPLETGGSWAMDQGVVLEREVIPWLEFTGGIVVDRVGFVVSDDGRLGCSPDGLIGDDGGVEIKCPQPIAHLRYLLAGKVPDDYMAQVHGSLYVTGRRWWKFVSYSRQFPPLIVHVKRDEEIMAKIDAALKDALAEFDAKLQRIGAMKEEYDRPIREAGLRREAAEQAKARAKTPDGVLPGERLLMDEGKLTMADVRARIAQEQAILNQ